MPLLPAHWLLPVRCWLSRCPRVAPPADLLAQLNHPDAQGHLSSRAWSFDQCLALSLTTRFSPGTKDFSRPHTYTFIVCPVIAKSFSADQSPTLTQSAGFRSVHQRLSVIDLSPLTTLASLDVPTGHVAYGPSHAAAEDLLRLLPHPLPPNLSLLYLPPIPPAPGYVILDTSPHAPNAHLAHLARLVSDRLER